VLSINWRRKMKKEKNGEGRRRGEGIQCMKEREY